MADDADDPERADADADADADASREPARALGRVVDPASLDAQPGIRARLVAAVPAAWCAPGAAIGVRLRPMLTCDRCDGGGCDACGRSGALRLVSDGDAGSRAIRVPLPPALTGRARVRLVAPFASATGLARLALESDAGPIEQLLVELRAADDASLDVWLESRGDALDALDALALDARDEDRARAGSLDGRSKRRGSRAGLAWPSVPRSTALLLVFAALVATAIALALVLTRARP